MVKSEAACEIMPTKTMYVNGLFSDKGQKKWQGLNPHKPRRPAAILLFTIADEANVISCVEAVAAILMSVEH